MIRSRWCIFIQKMKIKDLARDPFSHLQTRIFCHSFYASSNKINAKYATSYADDGLDGAWWTSSIASSTEDEDRDVRRGLRFVIWLSIHLSIRNTESLLARRRSAAVFTASVDVTRNVAANPVRNRLLKYCQFCPTNIDRYLNFFLQKDWSKYLVIWRFINLSEPW